MLVLCGTNRPGANTRKVSHRILELLQQMPDEQLPGPKLLDLADLQPDIFLPASYTRKPEWFLREFQAPITEARGMIVVTPEYNGSFPGVLKYFVDMLKFPESLVGMPVAFVGCAAGQFGALRPVEQISMVFHYRKAHIFGERVFMPDIGNAIQEDGTVGVYEERLQGLVAGFVQFVDNQHCATP